MVNTAIHLRRPLLVTGTPGCGKSTLALSVAYELGLGELLYWPITSRTTVQDGLYRYDAVGRLHAAGLRERTRGRGGAGTQIGKYLSLGPLGTALLPADRPRVLLIDEFDKGDIDLANDLLTVFEEGRFTVPELQRLPNRTVTVQDDDGLPVEIERGAVECAQFPIVVITSNGEREFPPAFLRRCIPLRIAPPSPDKLRRIVQAHLGREVLADPLVRELVTDFAEILEKQDGTYATDQLLNLLSLRTGVSKTDDDWSALTRNLLGRLDDQP
ncbi:ATPase [Actinoplanes sp. SE50]|uniref:AAA family ATPase n=1 Tax=unclassified Actinoplanes TaxID=2626549 RepID=UPI00023EC7B3|nr:MULTISPECIES: MoxR family ATPase [unclassified Actinoplanes]AEV84217.1 ATPase [Actinoplanes sp. SE50/110]ATO82609.1 ATPase [Actinoplanes sp. SE50]SLM00016.1 ATPase [Actinoplanes sp. SE50/110]